MGKTEMQDNGMKLHRKVSGRSCLSKRGVESKVLISNKKSGNTSYRKRYKQNPTSHVKKVKRNGKTVVEDLKTQKVDKRRRRKRRKENQEQDEASRLQRRTRYLVIKMKLEQNLIEAYSGEGWNGQSREKIKPVTELQRAMKQILKCKLGIRDAIRQLDQLGSEGCIEESVFGADGSVFHEHIFCAKCKLRDAFPDNDIILCDGTCNCAFHQKCLEPPLATENIPPEDQGWFCKYCDCKVEIIDSINAHLGTHFSTTSNWQDIFKEAAMANESDNASLLFEDEWPSDEPEDDDYDPDRNESSCSRTGSENNMHDDASSSSSFSWTSEEEGRSHSRGLGRDASIEEGFYEAGDIEKDTDKMNFHDSGKAVNSEDTTDLEITSRRRQRRDVDYRKLHDEMFGKEGTENEQASEDEDWGPSRRRRRLNESDAAGTLVTLCGVADGTSDVIPVEAKEKRTRVSEDKRKLFRIPRNAVEKLRVVFAENELPSRDVKENLSKQLGIASEKINKWFKNARYAALKTRKEDGTKLLNTSSTTDKPASAKRKSLTTDFVESSSDSHLESQATGDQIADYLRRVQRRKNQASKPKQTRRTNGRLQTSVNEVNTWISNATNLKRTLQKRVKSESEHGTSKDDDQPYLNEMERLFLLEGKLAELKEVLLRSSNRKNETVNQSHSNERIVMHVPVVTVKEKR